MNLPKLSVGQRLALGFAAVALLALGTAALSLSQLDRLGRQLASIVEVNNPKTDLATQMLDEINSMAVHARSLALLSVPKDIDDEFAGMEASIGRYARAERALAASLKAGGASTPRELELLKDIGEASKRTIPLVREAAQQGQDGATVEATMTLMVRVRPAETQWRQRVADLAKLEAQYSREALARSASSRTQATGFVAALAAASLLASALLAWRMTVSVTRPVHVAIALAERVAEGDLSSSVEVRSTDEFGRLMGSLARMQQSLARMVLQVRDSSDSISTASGEISSGNLDLSERTEQAASSLQQTAASMGQLTGNLRQSADAAGLANRLASSAAEVAARGGSVVSQVVATMGEINARSKKINDIIGVIDGIAFQINILALNAAVEAARAGEQGRGFAVVASEVRSLAQRSADAAREIKGLIGSSVEKVESGTRLVQDAGATMDEIVASVQRVTDVISEITAASAQQSDGIGQVNLAVTQLDRMTQQNAALVEQSTAAAGGLSEQVRRLTSVVHGFRLRELARD